MFFRCKNTKKIDKLYHRIEKKSIFALNFAARSANSQFSFVNSNL